MRAARRRADPPTPPALTPREVVDRASSSRAATVGALEAVRTITTTAADPVARQRAAATLLAAADAIERHAAREPQPHPHRELAAILDRHPVLFEVGAPLLGPIAASVGEYVGAVGGYLRTIVHREGAWVVRREREGWLGDLVPLIEAGVLKPLTPRARSLAYYAAGLGPR